MDVKASEGDMPTDDAIVPARPSATVLLLRDRPGGMEVLMLTRGAAAVFGSALVFPGGKLDATDMDPAWLACIEGGETFDPSARGLRIAAWREVFEEVGLLPSALAQCTPAVRAGSPFREIVQASGKRLPLFGLTPFARWITPRTAPARFDTWFFLSALDAEPVCDGYEAVSARWLRPLDAIALGAAGGCKLMFPTRQQLRKLAVSSTVEQAMTDAAARVIEPIEPRLERRDGRLVLTIPPDVGYDVLEEPFAP